MAVQNTKREIRFSRNVLKKNNVPLWFIANEHQEHFLITNLCSDATPIDLKTGKGRVQIEALGLRRTICRFGPKPLIRIESVSDLSAIKTSGMKQPKIEVQIPKRR